MGHIRASGARTFRISLVLEAFRSCRGLGLSHVLDDVDTCLPQERANGVALWRSLFWAVELYPIWYLTHVHRLDAS